MKLPGILISGDTPFSPATLDPSVVFDELSSTVGNPHFSRNCSPGRLRVQNFLKQKIMIQLLHRFAIFM